MQGATAACLAGCSSADADHRVDSPASVVAAGSPAPPSPSASSIGLPPVEPGAPAKAARATRERHEDALEAAIEAVGGLAFIQPGDSVFVKVNTGRVPLSVFELITATWAAEGFNLRDDWFGRLGKSGRHARVPVRRTTSGLSPGNLVSRRDDETSQ